MTMPKSTQECIREMSIRGCSQRRIARELHISRNTVAKYLKDDLSPEPPLAQASKSPKMEAYAETISRWLEDDLKAPRKQRHTAKKVFDRLVDERGFKGSLSTVERFVREWRRSRDLPLSEGFLELDWPAGTAQGDYGNAVAVLGGVETDVHALAITLPHSNARWAVCSMSQRSECLCESLLRIFEHIGGVPPVVVLDNATEAGRRLSGIVRESTLFLAFRQHYGFEARFCNPYAGHEKGSVENAVGFLRRNLMVPVPEATDLDSLNARLLASCDALLDSLHYREGVPIRSLLAEDRAALLPLSGTRFDCVRWERRRADREGRVTVDGTRYCAGPYWHGRWMLVGLRAGTVEIMDERGRHAATLPRAWSESGETVFDPAVLIPAVTARPRSWEQSQLRAAVPDALREGMDRCGTAERRQVLRVLGRASGEHGFDAAAQAAADIFAGGRLPDGAGVDLLVRRMGCGGTGGSADLGVYDALAGGGGRVG